MLLPYLCNEIATRGTYCIPLDSPAETSPFDDHNICIEVKGILLHMQLILAV